MAGACPDPRGLDDGLEVDVAVGREEESAVVEGCDDVQAALQTTVRVRASRGRRTGPSRSVREVG
jgi:hypothetical protein